MANELRCGLTALADPGLAAEIARFRDGARPRRCPGRLASARSAGLRGRNA